MALAMTLDRSSGKDISASSSPGSAVSVSSSVTLVGVGLIERCRRHHAPPNVTVADPSFTALTVA